MENTKVLLAGMLVAVFMSTAVYAQEPQEKPQGEKWQQGQFFKELNVTPEQQKKLEENRQAGREAMLKIRTGIKEKQQKLHEALKNPTVTRAMVDPVANEMKALQAQMIDNRINGIFAVKEVLTPEQFAKFQKMIEEKRGMMKRHFKEMRDKKGGPAMHHGPGSGPGSDPGEINQE